MNFGLLLVGLALVAVPALVGPRAGRLPPAEWAWVAATALGFGALCLYTGLIATTLPPILHVLQMEGLVGICDPVVHGLMIGGPAVGWIAAMLVLIFSVSGAIAIRRNRRAARRARVESWLGAHSDRGSYELVVLPTAALVAVGVPGRLPQIVVSQGLVDELDGPRLEAVVEHEVAHLRLRHHRLLSIVTVIERALGAVPLVRRSALVTRQSLEVWADDSASRSQRTDRSSLRSALLTVATGSAQRTARSSRDDVMARAHRLVDPPPRLSATVRGLAYVPLGGLVSTAAVCAVGWTLSSHQMLNLGGYC